MIHYQYTTIASLLDTHTVSLTETTAAARLMMKRKETKIITKRKANLTNWTRRMKSLPYLWHKK